MKKPANHLTSFANHLNEQYGERGTPTRDEFEEEFEVFKHEALTPKSQVNTPNGQIPRLGP